VKKRTGNSGVIGIRVYQVGVDAFLYDGTVDLSTGSVGDVIYGNLSGTFAANSAQTYRVVRQTTNADGVNWDTAGSGILTIDTAFGTITGALYTTFTSPVDANWNIVGSGSVQSYGNVTLNGHT
jgi:hypothetical protein